MDPLEHLAEKNKKHSDLLKKERKSHLIVLPFLLVWHFIYFGVIAFVTDFDGEIEPTELTEMTQQVWLMAMLFTFGIGTLFIANSFVNVVYLYALAKEIGAKVNAFNVITSCIRRLLIGAVFTYCGIWLDTLIQANKTEIARYMRFGFDYTPGIIEIIANGLIMLVAVIMAFAFMGMFFLPRLAPKHAEELKAGKKF